MSELKRAAGTKPSATKGGFRAFTAKEIVGIEVSICYRHERGGVCLSSASRMTDGQYTLNCYVCYAKPIPCEQCFQASAALDPDFASSSKFLYSSIMLNEPRLPETVHPAPARVPG